MMELELIREYAANGTNGNLYVCLCQTIELPWKENEKKVSCIPEGRYEVVKRYSDKFGWHMLLTNVEGRDLILIHPANDAKKELQGCIAPVSKLTGAGKGDSSRPAFNKLKELVYTTIDKKEKVFITIKAKEHEHSAES